MSKRIVVTGLGVVTPLGLNVKDTWSHLLNGTSGIGTIQHFDASGFPVHIAAEVPEFSLSAKSNAKHRRLLTPLTRYALAAATEAFDDAGLRPTAVNAERFGVVVGSGMMTAEYPLLERFNQTCVADSDGRIDWERLQSQANGFYEFSDFGKTCANTGLSLLTQEFGLRGYANSVHTACASGGQALGLALDVMRRGDADYMLVGGFDSMINPLGLSSFCLLGALSTYNETPTTASRPFDATRNGFVLGEGAAFLILESYETAKARHACIYAEYAGHGNSLSAYRITDSPPNGDGAKDAILKAIQAAGLTIDAVDHINAHGTSTQMNDLSETNAIKAVFGERAYDIPISATKSQTGHLIAAAGALEAVFSVLSIHTSTIPMTRNRQTLDSACDLNYVTTQSIHRPVGVVLSNSFGFGGSNSCTLFKHPDFEV